MAVDEAILEAVGRGVPATLRSYAGEPACLSLGYAQPLEDVDVPASRRGGWASVRRPTGGRAILHTDENDTPVIAPRDEPRVTGTVLESYGTPGAASKVEALRPPQPSGGKTGAKNWKQGTIEPDPCSKCDQHPRSPREAGSWSVQPRHAARRELSSMVPPSSVTHPHPPGALGIPKRGRATLLPLLAGKGRQPWKQRWGELFLGEGGEGFCFRFPVCPAT